MHKKAIPWRILVAVIKWRHRANGLLLIILSPAPFLTIKKLAFGSVVNCYHTLFASTSDKKFEIFKKLGQKNKTKQNKTKTIKQSFFENRRMLFFSECIQNIISDLKAICFVIFARKVFVSLNFGHYFESIAYSLGY